jgi:F-type H+-transporting ATPase subunit b
MPAFLTAEFYSLANPETWAAIGVISFLLIVWLVGGFKKAAGMLDAKAKTIQDNLDEAARLRAEAEAMLAQIRKERAEAEQRGAEMLANAKAEAKRLEAEAKAKLEEQIKRRQELAERRISNAEAQASAEVKAAAAELAAQMAEGVLAQRIAGAKSDPLVDAALGQLTEKLK